jgi:hypothetical protein
MGSLQNDSGPFGPGLNRTAYDGHGLHFKSFGPYFYSIVNLDPKGQQFFSFSFFFVNLVSN